MNYSKKVADKLIKKGWQVFDINKDNANGADLTIAKNGKSYRVEIKKACRSTRSWKVTPIGKSGIICDLIIIILPNDELIIQPMKDHLIHCAECGSRNITLLVEVNI
jgi:hypothetical protein